MLTNTAATLYNKYWNPETRREEWRRTELAAVHWESCKAADIGPRGTAPADTAFVMIWFQVDSGGKTYVDPKRYAALTPAEVDAHWTLTETDDRLLKGLPAGDAVLPSLKELDRLYTDMFTIRAVDAVDYGPPPMRHWEVTGA